MFVYALWFTIAAFVALKIIDWKGGKVFENLTSVRTKLFGVVVLGAAATVGIGVVEFLL